MFGRSDRSNEAVAVRAMLVVLGCGYGYPAQAQETESQLEEIVVTAQKRTEAAIEAPLSVTAASGNELIARQVSSMADLNIISPGIRSGQTNGVNRLFIRGIGLSSFVSGNDPSSAFYVDGVFVARPSFQLSSFFDVDRLEVVRGPQGTLYGRNATGGAVNLLTRDPTGELDGYLTVTGGAYGQHESEGALSGPLIASGRASGRIAFKLANRSGYGEDLAQDHPVNDAEQRSLRGSLKLLPSDNVSIRLSGEYHKESDNNYYTLNFGAYPGFTLAGLRANGPVPAGFAVQDSHDAATALKGDTNRRELFAGTALVSINLSDTLTLNSIIGYRHGDRHNASESDGTSAGLGKTFYDESSAQFSKELQLNHESEKLKLLIGLYHFNEKIDSLVTVPFPQFGVTYLSEGTMRVDAYAAFTQATYSVSPIVRLTLGGRYSSEKRKHVGSFAGLFVPVVAIEQSKRWNSFTPKAGIDLDITRDVLAYASVTKGFKSGTFNIGGINPPINPEKITAYEAGLKAQLLNRRLEATGAVFFYDYKDLQVNKIIGIAVQTVNAASARNVGVELATRAKVTERLMLDAHATYLDAKFEQFDSVNPRFTTAPAESLRGKQLPGAAKYSAGLGFAYEIPLAEQGAVTLRADAAYTSRVYHTEFNDINLSQDPFAKINASIKYESDDDDWFVSLWGKNITDKYIRSSTTLGIALWGYPIYGAVEPPATWGVSLGIKY